MSQRVEECGLKKEMRKLEYGKADNKKKQNWKISQTVKRGFKFVKTIKLEKN
jgi:hypothetical protein